MTASEKKKTIIWHNGAFTPIEKVHIGILSHSLHYGTGAFEGIRAYKTSQGTAIFRLQDHIDRFFFSASQYGIKIPYSKKTIATAIKETVRRNKLLECYVRPIVFFGEGSMGLSPKNARLHVAIAAWPWGAYLGERRNLSICISKYSRFDPRSIVPGAKLNGYYAMSALTTLDAKSRGFDECVMLDSEGHIAEGPGENIFIVKKKTVIAARSNSILPGITRESIMTIAKDMGLRVSERHLLPKDLAAADEAFFTGTAAEVALIGKFNGKSIVNHEAIAITPALRSAYLDIVHGKLPKYRKWLTTV